MSTYLDRCFCISSNLSASRADRCVNRECERYASHFHKDQARIAEQPIMWGDFNNPTLGIRCPEYRG